MTHTPAFAFLPPIGAQRQGQDALDTTLLSHLVVHVSERTSTGDELIAQLGSSGQGSERLQIAADGSFQVGVEANALGLASGRVYLIEVRALGMVLGTAELTWDERSSLGVTFLVGADPLLRTLLLRAQELDAIATALALVGEFELAAQDVLLLLADGGYDTRQIAVAAFQVFELRPAETAALLVLLGESEADVLDVLYDVYDPTPDEIVSTAALLVADGTFEDPHLAVASLASVMQTRGVEDVTIVETVRQGFATIVENLAIMGSDIAEGLGLLAEEAAPLFARAGSAVEEVADLLALAYLMSPEEIVHTLAALIRGSSLQGDATDLARRLATWTTTVVQDAAEAAGILFPVYGDEAEEAYLAVIGAVQEGYALAAEALAEFLAEHDAEVQLIADVLETTYQMTPQAIADAIAVLVESGAIGDAAGAVWTEFASWLTDKGVGGELVVQILVNTGAGFVSIGEALRDGAHVVAELAAPLLADFLETKHGERTVVIVGNVLDEVYGLGAAANAALLARTGFSVQDVTEVVVQLYDTPLNETVDFVVDLVQYYELDTVEFWRQAGAALANQYAEPLADTRIAQALLGAGVTAVEFLEIAGAWGLSALDAVPSLRDVYGEAADSVAQLLAISGIPAAQVLDMLVFAYETPLNETVAAMADLYAEYGLDVVSFWRSLGPQVETRFAGASGQDVASALNLAGVSAANYVRIAAGWGATTAESARNLVDGFGQTAQGVATTLKGVGYGATAIAGALRVGLGSSDSSAASTLRAVGYGATDIGRALVQAYGSSQARVAAILKSHGHSANTITIVLKNVAGATASSAAAALKAVGFGLSAIASAVVNQFNLTYAQARSLLLSLGYSLSEVVSALAGLF